KGAALFFRAYQYLQGMWIFAKSWDPQTSDTDLGIVLRQTSDQSVPSKRSTVSACYRQIIGDLVTAAGILPDLAESPMRPSKIACYGALSRAYLSIGKYDSAFYYVDKALAIKNDLIDYNDFSSTDLLKPYPLTRLNKETVFYAQLTTSYPNLHPSYGLVDTTLYASYGDNDIRKALFFKARNGFHSFKGNYTSAFNLFGGIAVDELFLIRAETNIRLGNVDRGLDDLNTLLMKRIKKEEFTSYVGLNQEDALRLIKKERRKELLMRGLRWMDIKRYNKYDGENLKLLRYINGTKYELEPNSNRYALPLPNDIILLTGMEQNPL
uniref:RagB/SusD family nutrient uptake outer membrane protein n=1 Tax=Sphingobacterium sp. HMA12 TaxID=2050894 RepID=UPI000CEA6FA7